LKSVLVSLVIVFVTVLAPLKSEASTQNEIYLRDDLILQLLEPQLSIELEHHFGGTTQYNCAQILRIKKAEAGSYLFTVDVQVITFEGPHNPPNYIVNMTFSNSGPDWKWRIMKFKSTPLDTNQKIPCRDPL